MMNMLKISCLLSIFINNRFQEKNIFGTEINHFWLINSQKKNQNHYRILKRFWRYIEISFLVKQRKNDCFKSVSSPFQKRQNSLGLIKLTKQHVSRTERFNATTLFCRLNRVIQDWKVKKGRKVNRWVSR